MCNCYTLYTDHHIVTLHCSYHVRSPLIEYLDAHLHLLLLQRRDKQNLYAMHLGACLAKFHHKKVLLVDFDAQANLSIGLGIGPDNLNTMVPVLQGQDDIRNVIQKTFYRRALFDSRQCLFRWHRAHSAAWQ